MTENSTIQSAPMSELEKFLSPENFLLSWEIIRNSLRLEVKDRLALDVYSSNRDKHLELLIELIRAEKYKPDRAERVYSPKADKTLRPFAWLTMHDRLVYQAIGNIILQNSYNDIRAVANYSVFAHVPQPPDKDGKFKPFIFEPAFPQWGFSGQFKKYSRKIISLMASYRDLGDGWVVKTDIASYYPSIDHTLLIELLRTSGWLTDKTLLELLEKCLGIWATYNPHLPFKQGIPIGYETSDLLATLFLMPIDTMMTTENCRILRYVDDTYLFVKGEENAIKTLIELDLKLQKNALIRNAAKTSIEKCDENNSTKKRVEHELRKRLSALNIEYKGPPEARESFQWSIYNDFLEIYNDALLNNPQRLGEFESEFSFILYRLEILDERAKEVALRLIDWFPQRTVNAVKYLQKFRDDSSVISKILSIARGSIYSEARLHCIDALIEQNDSSFSPNVIKILREWCFYAEDWQLKYEALKRLRKAPNQFKFVREVAHRNDHIQVQVMALIAWFEHSLTIEQKTEAINFAFSSLHSYIQALGLFMWMQQADIPRSALLLDLLPVEYEILFLDQEEVDSLSRLRNNLQTYCNIALDPEFRLLNIFENVNDTNQQILKAYNSETDMNKTVINLYKIVSDVLIFRETGRKSLFADKTLNQILPQLKRGISSIVLNLMEFYIHALEGNRVHPKERKRLISDVNFVLRDSFSVLQSRYRPATHRNDIPNVQIKIFLSYSHKDADFVDRLLADLENLGFDLWIDHHGIAAGTTWTSAIQQSLDNAELMILVMSPDAMESVNVEREWQYFLTERRKEVIPLLWKSTKIHYLLNNIQYVDFCSQEYDTALSKLNAVLEGKTMPFLNSGNFNRAPK